MAKNVIGNSVLDHFLTDETGKNCGPFTFSEADLKLFCSRDVNLNDQPAQVTISHPKIPGLSWIIFFYQTGSNQYQPKIAYDFPSYLRSDSEVCIQFAGMHWVVKHKFEGSAWLSSCLPPKVMNERWVTMGTIKKVEVRVTISKIWFKFPIFTCCCYPTKMKKYTRQPDFTCPDYFSDVQLVPEDPSNRRLFGHRQVLALNSPWFAERFRSSETLNNGDTGHVISVPFRYEDMHNFLKIIYPNRSIQVSEFNVEGLMDVAKEYQVPNVLRKAELFLYKNLEAGSAVLSYYLARKYELPHLQDAALLHLSELNSSQLKARLSMDMKDKPADAQEVLLNDLCIRLANAHM